MTAAEMMITFSVFIYAAYLDAVRLSERHQSVKHVWVFLGILLSLFLQLCMDFFLAIDQINVCFFYSVVVDAQCWILWPGV